MTPERASLADERWHLRDQRDFLVRSLADAEREHDVGDLSDQDFELLQRRDTAKLEEVDAALRALDVRAAVAGVEPGPSGQDQWGPAPGEWTGEPASTSDRDTARPEVPTGAAGGRSAIRRRPRRRRWLATGGVVAILVAGVVLLVAHMTAPSLPGQDPSGSVVQSPTARLAQELQQAADTENGGHLLEALGQYQKILLAHPAQPQALAEAGWIEYELGSEYKNGALVQDGQAMVEHAVVLAPRAYAGHLYLGTIELERVKNVDMAVEQYSEFLALDPPHRIVAHAAPFIRTAYTDAKVPVPSGL